MNQKPNLYICMEVKVRELEGRTLLALEAASRGFRVFLGSKGHIRRAINASLLPPGIYFDKSMQITQERYFEYLLSKGFLVASLDEEGGLLDRAYDRFITTRSTKKTVDMASAIFCWGEHDYSYWSHYYETSINKIHATGCPRIDFWRTDFKDYFRKDVISIKQKYKNFVLVSSNFVLANGYLTVEDIIDQGKKEGFIKSQNDENELISKIEDSKKMFRHFVQLISYLADKHKDIEFIVRPHPAEKILNWKNNLPPKKNVHVVFEGGISSWVRSAIAVLHNGCTTGMEAYVAGVPAFAYTPFSSPINREIPNRLSINCTTEKEVSSFITTLKQGKKVTENETKENNKLIESRLANVNGNTAVSKIVDKFHMLNANTVPPPKFGLKSLKIRTRLTARHILNRLSMADNKSLRTFEGLNIDEITIIQNKLSEVNKSYMDCSIKHCYGNVFVVE